VAATGIASELYITCQRNKKLLLWGRRRQYSAVIVENVRRLLLRKQRIWVTNKSATLAALLMGLWSGINMPENNLKKNKKKKEREIL